ncbi:MIP/aquaporin family protein [Protaetiibacter intestinalis]|uniref:Aquaporin family protein n=1 Tax=Protaetiibacter intestinalis TaxID=2419774 RepID=A0A387B140_9MICO|nr:aquaporin [Protaetiibacter intestinalis]AYF97222.1 hypothetical protein D7I47_02465 [Protaetiibacter intestinalis]
METTVLPQNGWHWREWGSELLGTAILMWSVVTALWVVTTAWSDSTVFVRVLVVGSVAGVAVIGIAESPLGRRSGAHLNPALTLSLWVRRVVSAGDLAGYVAAQAVGAIVGFGAGIVWGPGVAAAPVRWATIAPEPGLGDLAAGVIEAVTTAALLSVVFVFLGRARLVRYTAWVAGATLTAAIIGLAQVTGAAFNPLRGVAPEILAGSYQSWLMFLVAPPLGGVIAALGWRGAHRPVTGKLVHDPAKPCRMYCELPHAES